MPYEDAGQLSAKLLRNGILKTYDNFPYELLTTRADTADTDMPHFIRA